MNDEKAAALAAIMDATAQLSKAQSLFEDGLKTLSTLLETPPKAPRPKLVTYQPKLTGRKSKLDRDPELRMFVMMRMDELTLTELAQKVAENFPPDRRVSKSAISNWWRDQIERQS